jgi:hypothetical protein
MSVNEARTRHEKSRSKEPFDGSTVEIPKLLKVPHAVSNKYKAFVSVAPFTEWDITLRCGPARIP